MVALTIGMPTYNDFDGVFFTVQSLRLHQDLADTEILVVDNFGCDHTRAFIENCADPAIRYVRRTEITGTAPAKDRVFREALGDAVLCCDSHILFAPTLIPALSPVAAHHDSAAGRIEAGWTLSEETVTYDLAIPEGARGTLVLDPAWRDPVLDGAAPAGASGRVLLDAGRHTLRFRVA